MTYRELRELCRARSRYVYCCAGCESHHKYACLIKLPDGEIVSPCSIPDCYPDLLDKEVPKHGEADL